MKPVELLEVIGDARETYIHEAEGYRSGTNQRMSRKKLRPLMIAAIIGLMILLMGCAVYVLGLQNLKIGEKTTYGEILDSKGNVLVNRELTGDVISLHGLINSPTYLAHQEWFEFYEEYYANHVITEEENFFVRPEAYEAYSVYNQELIDKVDEISQKYNLKLLGAFAPFQDSESSVFYDATGLNSLLTPKSDAYVADESGYFYEGGNFKVEFHMTMPDAGDYWPHDMLNTVYYSKADYFDTIFFVVWDRENWDQWNYTTSSGTELLIVREKSGYSARIFCTREDALIYVGIDGSHEDSNGNVTFMTKQQLNQVAEQFDYEIKVESVDMELAKEKLSRFNRTSTAQTESKEGTIFDDYIRDGLENLGDRAGDYYYHLIDVVGNDGFDELVIGTKEEMTKVWMLKKGTQMVFITDWNEACKSLQEIWPTMNKKPITEYFAQ